MTRQESLKIEKIEDRLHKLERTFDRLSGGAIVLAFSIPAFFGFTSWYQIPDAVNSAVPAMIKKYIDEEIPGLRKNLVEFQAEAAKAAASAKGSATTGAWWTLSTTP